MMQNNYNENLDAGLELKEKDHRRLTEYLNLLANATTKEEAQQIESLYSDLSDFRFIKRFVPDIDNTEWNKYKIIIETIRNNNIAQFKHIYNYEPIQKELDDFSNTNKSYTVKEFLQEASLCQTPEEYNVLYKKKYNFKNATLSYTSPLTISLFSSKSELPIITVPNSNENKAKLYEEASKKGYDLGFIPTPDEIYNNGLHLITEKITDFSNNMNITFQNNEEEKIESSIYEKYQQNMEDYQEDFEEQYNEQQSLQENSGSNIITTKEFLQKKPLLDSVNITGEIKSVLGNNFSGENINITKEFQKKLIAEGLVKPDEPFVILNELEAKAKGTFIKKSAEKDFITLNIPVMLNGKTNFVPTKYYHTSSLEEPSIVSSVSNTSSFESNDTKLLSLKQKHQLFVNNPYAPGTPVPNIGIRNESTGNIDILSGFSYSKSEDMGHTVVLSNSEKEFKISSHLYKQAIQNSLIITNNTTITNEVLDQYLEKANLDQDRQRLNTASNFWHNYKAYCRVHCNNQQEALEAAKHIISEMQPSEKIKLKKQVLRYQKLTNESYNDRLISFYQNSVSDKRIKDFSPFSNKVLLSIRDFSEINDKIGSKLDKNCRMKIGDKIKMRIEVKDAFKKHSMIKLPVQELILISTYKDGNSVVLSDKNGTSKYTMALDDFVKKVQKIEKKNQKEEKKKEKIESISYI